MKQHTNNLESESKTKLKHWKLCILQKYSTTFIYEFIVWWIVLSLQLLPAPVSSPGVVE